MSDPDACDIVDGLTKRNVELTSSAAPWLTSLEAPFTRARRRFAVAACGCAPGRVTTSAIAAATTLGASSTPRLSRATSIAGADMTSPTVSSACAQVPVAAAAKLSAARTIKTTYHHAGAVLGVHQPEIGDQVGHAPRGRGRSEESRQQGTIMSPSFRSNRQPSGRLTSGATDSGTWD